MFIHRHYPAFGVYSADGACCHDDFGNLVLLSTPEMVNNWSYFLHSDNEWYL